MRLYSSVGLPLLLIVQLCYAFSPPWQSVCFYVFGFSDCGDHHVFKPLMTSRLIGHSVEHSLIRIKLLFTTYNTLDRRRRARVAVWRWASSWTLTSYHRDKSPHIRNPSSILALPWHYAWWQNDEGAHLKQGAIPAYVAWVILYWIVGLDFILVNNVL